jgi:deazaflavin-dependent oxidoreductase (nitroreductase family)
VNSEVRRALAINLDSTAEQRTVDVTTTGRRSGRPYRFETWFYRSGDRIFLSGWAGRRDWYANLLADPRLVFHLKHGVRADLPATGRMVTDPGERRRVFSDLVTDMKRADDPARMDRPEPIDEWMAGRPLVEVIFD